MLPETVAEPLYQRRMHVNYEAKRQIAKLVSSRIEHGDTLFLDNGTTTTYVADALAQHSGLTIVTNSAEIACRVARQNGNRVFMAGGELHPDDAAAFGAATLDFIRQFQVRYALISVAGITARGELVDFHLFEAEITRVAIEQATETWVIADHSKFGRDAPIKVCSLDAVDLLITDAPPPPDYAQKLAGAEVAIITP